MQQVKQEIIRERLRTEEHAASAQTFRSTSFRDVRPGWVRMARERGHKRVCWLRIPFLRQQHQTLLEFFARFDYLEYKPASFHGEIAGRIKIPSQGISFPCDDMRGFLSSAEITFVPAIIVIQRWWRRKNLREE